MAASASHRGVLAGQGERRSAVIEVNIAPGLLGMASPAPSCRNQFVDLTMMRVAMTLRASDRRERELLVTFRSPVTLFAGDREMCTAQGERSGRMTADSEARRAKTLHGMALLTRAALISPGKGALMVVRMAVATKSEFHGSGRSSRTMTFVARHRGMLSLKGVASAAVVERFRSDLLPAFGAVAVGARRSEAPRMGIAMAGAALTVLDGPVPHKAAIGRRVDGRHERVAFFAGYLGVPSKEMEVSRGVIEVDSRTPSGGRVAVTARPGELTAVLVDVTRSARSLQAEPGSFQRDVFSGYYGLILDVLGLMTLATLQSGVLAVELEAGDTVVERLRAAFEVDKLIVATVVFNMTHNALAVLRAGVKPRARASLFIDQSVTFETLARQLVTFRAVAAYAVVNALQGSVRPLQFARRNLSFGERHHSSKRDQRRKGGE